MHKLLARQARRILGADESQIPALLEELNQLAGKPEVSPAVARTLKGLGEFLLRVDEAYVQSERDLDLRSRSLMLSSVELSQINERMRELNGTLERRVVQRTEELESAMDKLQQLQQDLTRNETQTALNTVIASVSHELSTPLGNSLMMASTLIHQSKTFQKQLDANQIKRSDLGAFVKATQDGNALMMRNLERAAELLNNFRQVANDQASGLRREFQLATVATEIVDTLAPSLKRHPHRVILDIPPDIPMEGPPGPLGQIIMNLINNAYIHAFEGKDDGVLTISAQHTEHGVSLSFSDNGVGISREHLARLFEPFFSTKRGRGGTGLGMGIVQSLVRETLGGTIRVESELGRGTCFLIQLPLVAPHPQAH
ncbi:MAG: sensor histidine kinase [Curvibacter sp.]|nr:MAG: sensor histidine kinase [Curvibacter sp.]